MKKLIIRVITGEHHRRARSIGGAHSPANISYLRIKPHKAWHVLVGNMNAYQTCDFLNHIEFKPENINITCVFINGTQVTMKGKNNSKNPRKIKNAWKTLFGDLEFKDAIAYINNQLLDPSYHLYLEEKK